MTATPKIGVIGVGTFGLKHLQVFANMEDEGLARLVAFCDASAETLHAREDEFGRTGYADFREMLEKEDLDAVTVATPDFLHREIALAAIAAQKHVLIEKPMDTTSAGCNEILAAAEESDKLMQVDFHKRCDPYHIGLRNLVQEGKLGKVLYGSAIMEDRIDVPRDWFPHWAPKSSPVWFLGVHMMDLIRWIIGDDAVRVFASGQKQKLVALGVDTYDSVQVQVDFQRGACFTFHAAWVLPDEFESVVNQEIRVVGTEGMMEVDSQYRGARGCLGKEVKGNGMATLNLGGDRTWRDRSGRTRYSGYVHDSIREFAENVRFLMTGGTLEQLKGTYADARDGLEVTRIAEAAHQSLGTGEPVAIERATA